METKFNPIFEVEKNPGSKGLGMSFIIREISNTLDEIYNANLGNQSLYSKHQIT